MTITFSMGESGFGDSPDVLLHNPENSFFMEYARRVALHLGDVSLDTTVRILDEGSLFNDDNHYLTR